MARILVDTCIIADLGDPLSDWHDWSASTLEGLDADNVFIINPVIYAECSIGYDTIEEVERLLGELAFEMVEVPREALFLAGKAFVQYRRRQGTKGNVLPDFFIGAHAAVEDFCLLTRDKGRFASYFPSVELIMP